MKNLMIRTFVVALAVAGFSASAVSAKTASHKATSVVTSGMVPVCSPHDPHGCGMDQQ